jgi:transcriptional regulator
MPVYLPAHFEQSDPAELAGLITAAPLGMLVTRDGDESIADHIPFLFEAPCDDAPSGTLQAHVARANPVWQRAAGQRVLVVFGGPNGYVSPSWYAAKAAHGRVVPTWNYAVVHAYGRLVAFDDPTRLRSLVGRLTDRFERPRAQPWSIDDAPADYLRSMLDAIRGIEIRIDRLVGKFKLGQNRSTADRATLRAGLDAERGADDPLAELTRRHT